MKIFKKIVFPAFGLLMLSATAVFAQQVQRTPFDVKNYVMDVALDPVENKLTATVDVTFVPLEDTRSVSFELNGSLKIDTITRQDKPLAPASASATPTTAPTPKPKTPVKTPVVPQPTVTFIQDQVGVSDLGPSVKIDLGDTVTKGTNVILRFKYSGILVTPQGGPLLTKRLAYIGPKDGYLMYAARWFPFHDYAADFATSDISISLPSGMNLVGMSDAPVTQTGGKSRFVRNKESLVGTFAYGRYTNKTLRFGEYELQFNTKTPSDALVANYGETLGRALQFYTKKYGMPDSGNRLIVSQIDDESLDFYSSPGQIFIGTRPFEQAREVTSERLQREAAIQWWGLTVGLRSFDDAWLSQGLAEFSAISLRESLMTGAQLDNLRRELLEKSLTFEQTASLTRTPANLDDQSVAYQYIMYAKGAFVFKLLRDTLGEAKFNQLMNTYLQRFRGKNASIDDFEKLTSEVAGQPMRYFFARWVEGTGVPEFTSDYLIIRTRAGKFITRGTVKQNYDNLRLPLEIQLKSEGEGGLKTITVQIDDSSADFNIESDGKPLGVIIDPNHKLLRISPELRISSIARRGIEQFKEGNYVEAQKQFEEALKLDRSNSWIYYHLGLLFLEQRNYDLAIDNFKATLGGRLEPTWLSVWSNIKMGNAYDAKGDRTRAVAAYKRAENLGDNYDNAQEAVKKYQATPYDPKEKTQTTAVK
ncbi:MAG: tetratricopeptide repeat protein [Pyrinomonadaceae bacterium]|nr:tetratricopeptide repeat protein [Pyrinomonadaceae bacterium]